MCEDLDDVCKCLRVTVRDLSDSIYHYVRVTHPNPNTVESTGPQPQSHTIQPTIVYAAKKRKQQTKN